ncbi:glycoside hydrolase family 1 protein [Thermococcus sp. M39]|uniref:family 1 glycosylhydrolase n=1 Tax=unclassified Thermococcus TaxID=2627626 RepID=UPI00143AC964|nr:glycoside hydrolase family 1 protein [Thermococcus sp. M39]NJE13432.1 glycoside hydrolase family 1 protein [Thermococcus sp. LS2]
MFGGCTKFPDSFLLGTATSSYQIEGDNVWSDWWYWAEKRKLPKAEKACNHWELYKEDIELMASLGYPAYRFSIEWARIFPEEGKLNEAALIKYQELINLLNKKGITPMLTIHHFTLPTWFALKGGFEKEENLKYWEEYISVITELKGVELVATFNEPMVYVVASYLMGMWPPFKKNPLIAGKVAVNMINAHAIAYEILHGKFKVGIVKNYQHFIPASDSKRDKEARDRVDYLFNWAFIDGIFYGSYEGFMKKHKVSESDLDFIGINYYNIQKVKKSRNPLNPFIVEDANVSRKTDMGWSVYPKGIYDGIRSFSRYEKPMYITENGIATLDDEWRIEFIVQHLQYVHKAIKEGFDINGYFYWSFMDNYEWAEGFRPRFGLIEIDYETFERKPRRSAYIYGEITKKKEISDEVLEKYGLEEF